MPKPTGISSGNSNNRGLTIATTRNSTTGWSTADPESVHQHLRADLAYQEKMVRFLENHDEPRAAATFGREKECAAAVAILTLMGATLLHEGQFEGRQIRLPVFLGRRPEEPVDQELVEFYKRLLKATNREVFRYGAWRLCERVGWPDNQSYRNLLAWCWVKDTERYLVVINFRQEAAQARVLVPWDELRGKEWRCKDVLSGESYDRSGSETRDDGLYVDLEGWKCHLFHVTEL